MNEVIITYLQLPITVNGLVTPTPDGDYQVILNSRLGPEAQRRAYCHELRHILQNHFVADALPVHALEAAAQPPGGGVQSGSPGRAGQSAAAAPQDTLQAHIERAEEHGLPSRAVSPPQTPPCTPAAAFGAAAVGAPGSLPLLPPQPADVFPEATASPAPPTRPCAVLPGLGPGNTKYAPALLRAVRAQLTGLQY